VLPANRGLGAAMIIRLTRAGYWRDSVSGDIVHECSCRGGAGSRAGRSSIEGGMEIKTQAAAPVFYGVWLSLRKLGQEFDFVRREFFMVEYAALRAERIAIPVARNTARTRMSKSGPL
jgi:hypothetical protein